MKLPTRILAATTAITLVASAGWANNNEAYLDQNGVNNTSLIEQDLGSGNKAGTSDPVRTITQDGNENEIDILQSGDDNFIGTASKNSAPGVDQMGDRNILDIEQSSINNFVNVVQQTGPSGATETTNSLVIDQTATAANFPSGNAAKWGNVVSRVIQINTGTGTSAAETNTVTISQDRSTAGGPGGFGSNAIGQGVGGNINDRFARVSEGVYQEGTGNDATLTQSGERNVIREVEQVGANNAATVSQTGERNLVMAVLQTGDMNMATLTFDGNDNGAGMFSAGSDAESVGAPLSTVDQLGNSNTVSLMTVGDDNQFGFKQTGDFNSATGSQTGDFNEIAVVQGDDSNIVAFNQNGTGNNAGFSQ